MHNAYTKEIIANHKSSELLINLFQKWMIFKILQKLYDGEQLIWTNNDFTVLCSGVAKGMVTTLSCGSWW